MTRRLVSVAICASALMGVATTCAYDHRHAKESAELKNVQDGTAFQAVVPYEKAYEATLNDPKRQGYTLDSTGKDTGQIIAAMDIKGGMRVQVTYIQDNDSQTSIRIAVTEQKRKKLLQTELWGDPKVNERQRRRLRTKSSRHSRPRYMVYSPATHNGPRSRYSNSRNSALLNPTRPITGRVRSAHPGQPMLWELPFPLFGPS